jgi:hypothetical protein
MYNMNDINYNEWINGIIIDTISGCDSIHCLIFIWFFLFLFWKKLIFCSSFPFLNKSIIYSSESFFEVDLFIVLSNVLSFIEFNTDFDKIISSSESFNSSPLQ